MIAIRTLRASVLAVARTDPASTRAVVEMAKCIVVAPGGCRRPPKTTTTTTMTNYRQLSAAPLDDGDGMSTNLAKRRDDDGPPRTSVLMELTDRVGALHDVLRYL